MCALTEKQHLREGAINCCHLLQHSIIVVLPLRLCYRWGSLQDTTFLNSGFPGEGFYGSDLAVRNEQIAFFPSEWIRHITAKPEMWTAPLMSQQTRAAQHLGSLQPSAAARGTCNIQLFLSWLWTFLQETSSKIE